MKKGFSVFALFLTFLANCLLAESTYKEIVVQNPGMISGVVRLSGSPATKDIPVLKDQTQCGAHKTTPCLKLGKNNGIANAVVYLDNILQGKKLNVSGKYTLDQKNCEYVPHVMVVPAGAELAILNSDPILHNVHTYDLKAPDSESKSHPTWFNIAFPVKGQRVVKKLPESGRFLSLCDAGHPWMSAHIIVAAHPYYAITDANGAFVLDGVPPGTYKIKVWHEGLVNPDKTNAAFLSSTPLEADREVLVPPNGKATADFTLTLK